MNPGSYPPGVTGLEPEITDEWPCTQCGTILPEDCTDNICPDRCDEPEYDPEPKDI